VNREDTQKTKPYRVQNRITKQEYIVEATSAQEACYRCGWMIGDCYIRELTAIAPGVTKLS